MDPADRPPDPRHRPNGFAVWPTGPLACPLVARAAPETVRPITAGGRARPPDSTRSNACRRREPVRTVDDAPRCYLLSDPRKRA
jgi:hypothetical protein